MINKKFDSLYFLHIPKTGGRQLLKTVIWPITQNNDSIKSLNVSEEYDVSDGGIHAGWTMPHEGWSDNITDRTYVVSIMRDPVERLASHFIHQLINYINDTPRKFDSSKESIRIKKEMFIEFAEQAKRYHNFMSKMIVYNNKNFDEYLMSHKNFDIDMDLLEKRIKRINLFLDVKDLKNDIFFESVSNKISKDVGVNPAFRHNDKAMYIQKSSSSLYISLTDEEKSYLKKFNEIDYSIYNNKSIFWNPSEMI